MKTVSHFSLKVLWERPCCLLDFPSCVFFDSSRNILNLTCPVNLLSQPLVLLLMLPVSPNTPTLPVSLCWTGSQTIPFQFNFTSSLSHYGKTQCPLPLQTLGDKSVATKQLFRPSLFFRFLEQAQTTLHSWLYFLNSTSRTSLDVREQNFKAFWVKTLEITPSTLRTTTLHISRLVAFCLLMPHVLPQRGKWGSRARQHISPGIRKSSSLNSSPNLLSDVLYAFDFMEVSKHFSSVQFSRSVMSDSLQPHELQHSRPPCPTPTRGVHSDSRPSSPWCHPAISSSVFPFSSCLQPLPASESFLMSQLFAWGGQSTEVSA